MWPYGSYEMVAVTVASWSCYKRAPRQKHARFRAAADWLCDCSSCFSLIPSCRFYWMKAQQKEEQNLAMFPSRAAALVLAPPPQPAHRQPLNKGTGEAKSLGVRTRRLAATSVSYCGWKRERLQKLPVNCDQAAMWGRWKGGVCLGKKHWRDGWSKETASQNFSKTWCPPQTVLFEGPEIQTCLKQSWGSKNGTVASCEIVTSYFIAVFQLQLNRCGGKQRSR